MKLLILLLLASPCLCAQPIRLSLQNAPFRQFLKSIERQTGYSFVYTKEQIQRLPLVTIDETNKDLFILLNEQLNHSNIGYAVENNFIILYTKSFLTKDSIRTVTGRLVNDSREAIIGATVQVKDQPYITITDKQGYFSLPYHSSNALLQVSGAELKPVIISIDARNYIEILIEEPVKELDETIIIAYGKTTRRLSTGNFTKVSSRELENQPNGNLLAALQGRVPGLLITATSGAPGASFNAQIRGQNSVNPNPLINNGIAPLDNPFILVNGVPFAPQNNSVNQLSSLASPGNLEMYHNPYGGISPFNNIDPSDIESVEVLKDADMTAIYGSRAANGIILITTRQPEAGKVKLHLDMSTGINVSPGSVPMLTTKEYLDLRRTAFQMDSILPGIIPGQPDYAPDLLIFDSTRNTNWHRYFFHAAAPVTSIHTRVSGGSTRLNFVSGAGYRQEAYLLRGDFYNKVLSTNNQVKYRSRNNRLQLDGSLHYSQGINQSVGSPQLLKAVDLPPNYPALRDEQGRTNWEYKGAELTGNPVGLLDQIYTIRTNNLVTQTNISYKISQRLSLRLLAGLSKFSSQEVSVIPQSSFHPLERTSSHSLFGKSEFETKLIEPQGEYQLWLGKTRFNFLAGATMQRNNLSLSNTKGTHYIDDQQLNQMSAAGIVEKRSTSDEYQYQSFFGRISLSYREKYLANFTARREGSSRFTNTRQFGDFYSLSAGWVFSEEKLIRKVFPIISFGKIRFSYGTAGNDNIGYYHHLEAWAFSPSYLGNQPVAGSLSDAEFTWSKTRKAEAGIEIGLLHDRISFSLSLYSHRTSDQLISLLSSFQPGTSRYVSNFPATVLNKGWELTFETKVKKTKMINWICSFNLTIPKNELTAFSGIENSLYAGRYFIGRSLGTKQLILSTGVDKQSGLYTFDPAALVFTGLYTSLYGGFRNSLTYKQFKCELLIDFRKQNGTNFLHQKSYSPVGLPINQPRGMMDYWQYPGQVSSQQKPTTIEGSLTGVTSLMFGASNASYSNASFIRLNNIVLSYSFDQKRLAKNGPGRFKMYLRAQNVFTITPFKITNPETQSLYSLPLLRTFIVGIQMQL